MKKVLFLILLLGQAAFADSSDSVSQKDPLAAKQFLDTSIIRSLSAQATSCGHGDQSPAMALCPGILVEARAILSLKEDSSNEKLNSLVHSIKSVASADISICEQMVKASWWGRLNASAYVNKLKEDSNRMLQPTINAVNTDLELEMQVRSGLINREQKNSWGNSDFTGITSYIPPVATR